ncbi:MAG: MFS transporter [Bacillota bacterium]|nr:MFS transporter [Bacillota bacterium]
MLGILKNRNYAILFSGQLVSTIGNNLYTIALPWYVYSITGSKKALVLSGLSVFIPHIAGLFVGTFTDRWIKKDTMIWVDLLRGIITILLAVLAIKHVSFYYFIALVFLLQLVGSFFSPASSAMTPLLVEKEDLPSAFGLSQSGNAVAQLIGTVGGGALFGLIGAPLLFFSNGISFFLSVLSLCFIRIQETIHHENISNSFIQNWLNGIQMIYRSKSILRIIAAGLLANFGLAPLEITFTAWIKGPMHSNSFSFGLINAGFLTGLLIGGLLMPIIRKRINSINTLKYGLLFIGIWIALIGVFPNFYWALSVMTIVGIALALVNTSLDVLLVDIVPQHMRGRVFGAFNGLIVLSGPIGLSILGSLLSYISLSWMFVIIGALSLVGGLIYYIPIKNNIGEISSQTQSV